jgi:hypothetical protein
MFKNFWAINMPMQFDEWVVFVVITILCLIILLAIILIIKNIVR